MAAPTKGLINSRYRIKSPLGSGGMGSVHLAEDRATGNSLVALKIVTHEAAEEALSREFEILARLRHPHLPAVFDFGSVDGESSRFLSMEYIQGRNLVEAAADLTADEVLDLIAQLCRALEFVHTRGLVHRDLKPDNVLVTAGAAFERRAVLVDFGLASRSRVEGVAAGTLAYVAPEALRGGTIDGRSDLYALGAILYQLSTGRVPFEGSGKEIIRGHLELEPTPPMAAGPTGAAAPLRPLLEPALSAIILRLLSKEPSQRFASAAETLQAINRATGRRHPIETAETGVAYATWAPLVGREAELARLTSLVDRPKGGLLALVTGEAGVGKTRFLSEARRYAQVHGKLAAGVACRPGMPAFQPIVEALALLGGEPLDLGSAADPTASTETSRVRTVDAAASQILARAAATPTALFLDDAHLADAGTLSVCEALARGDGDDAPPLLIVLACRIEEMDSPALAAALARLRRHARVEEISLGPLDAPRTAALLRGMLGLAEAPEPLVALVQRETSGNPSFIEEAVRSLMEDGTISRLGLSFRADVDALTTIAFPAGVGDAIRRRLSRLDGDERLVLDALAAAGRPSERALLRDVSGLSDPALDAALAALRSRGLAGEQAGADPSYYLESARVREHVYDALDWDRKRALHAALASALRARADAGARVRFEELARHFIESGDAEVGLSYALEAARRSRSVGAGAESVGFYRQALELIAAGSHAERSEILRSLGMIEREMGRDAQALETFEQALRTAMQASRRDLAALARLEKASTLMARGRPDEAVREVERALELQAVTGDLILLARGESILSGVFARTGRMDRAMETQRRALDAAQRAGNPRTLAAAMNNLANLEFVGGRHDEAIAIQRRSIELRREIGDAQGELQASSNLGLFLVEGGRLEEAIPVLDECVTISKSLGDLPSLVESRINLGAALSIRGAHDLAIRSFEEAAGVAIRIGDEGRASNALDGWGAALRTVGDADGAAERHAQALERARRAGDAAQEAFALASLALDRAVAGDADAAREAARRASRLQGGDLPPRARARLLEATSRVDLATGALVNAAGTAGEMLALARGASLGPEEAQALLLQATAALAASDAAAAREAVDEAIGLLPRGKQDEILWRALAFRASLHGVDAAAARADRDEAAGIIAALAERIADGEWRARYVGLADRAAVLAASGKTQGMRPLVGGSLAAIYRMSELITAASDTDEMLAGVLDLALEIVHAERGLIILLDGDRQEVRAARGIEPETMADALEYSRSVVRETAQARTLITLHADSDDRTQLSKSVSLFRIQSLACIPMRIGARVIGTVYLDSRTPGTAFDDEQVEFLKAFANLAAAAMEMSRLNAQLASENVSLVREVQDLRKAASKRTSYQHLIGKTVRMQAVYDLLDKVSASSLPVLISGESGTGKELVARAIHFTGPRRERKFLSENVAAIPETLLESELFGHMRGAFTGADRDRKGVFELADGGTLFLDEIGDMSLPLQAKVLRALQEGEIRPVGGKNAIKVDVRIVSATHRDLDAMMKAGTFREDLFYRLNVVRINIPSLRERKEDIPLLVEHFLTRAAEASGVPRKRMDISALQLLLRYDWPGNVRELENEIMKLSVLTAAPVITQQDLVQHRDLLEKLTRLEEAEAGFQSLDTLEKKQIEKALAESGGNRARAATLLGISRATIYRKLREYGISD